MALTISEETRTYRDRVARGAELLDKLVPGWHKKIDLDALNLSSCSACVCGQLAYATADEAVQGKLYGRDHYDAWNIFRRYLRGKLRRRNANLAEEIVADPEKFGFCTIRESYPTLDAEWKRVITARLGSSS